MAADLTKLKKKASDLESKKDLGGAIAAYRQIVDLFESGGADPIDIPLYNRLGDLLMRDGRSTDAIQTWERAIEHYMEGGFLNPAIALANKILRASPGRTAAYYTLGRCLAQKGLRAEARQNFLEYATRMQRAGNLDDAFRALKELADLVPDQDDVRVMLAEELAKADRVPEAIEQLQLAHARLRDAGKAEEAEVVAARALALDPTVTLGDVHRPAVEFSSGLVFLDLERQPAAPAVEPPPERMLGFETTALVEPMGGLEVTPPTGHEVTGLEPLLDWTPEAAPSSSAPSEAPSPPAFDGGLELLDLGDPEPPRAPGAAPTAPGDLPLIDLSEPAPTPAPLLDLPLLDVSGVDLASAAAAQMAPIVERTGPSRRPTSSVLLRPIDLLRADLERAPDDLRARRAYGEALVDEGQREAGIAELERALSGLEAAGDLEGARQVAEDLVRLVPTEVRFHSRRVDLLFTVGAGPAAVEAALALGDLLTATGELADARRLYTRILRIAPDDLRAQLALASLASDASSPGAAPDASAGRAGAEGLVDVGAWFSDAPPPAAVRIVVPGEGVEDRPVDFTDMLDRFKAGVAASVDESDHAAHYDLGIAYREMGLLDEAIAEFQKALRASPQRTPVLEALGACFLDKGQPSIAATLLRRALDEPGATDDALLGVLYLLADAAQAQGDIATALQCFERIVVVDIGFRDAVTRLQALQSPRP